MSLICASLPSPIELCPVGYLGLVGLIQVVSILEWCTQHVAGAARIPFPSQCSTDLPSHSVAAEPWTDLSDSQTEASPGDTIWKTYLCTTPWYSPCCHTKQEGTKNQPCMPLLSLVWQSQRWGNEILSFAQALIPAGQVEKLAHLCHQTKQNGPKNHLPAPFSCAIKFSKMWKSKLFSRCGGGVVTVHLTWARSILFPKPQGLVTN